MEENQTLLPSLALRGECGCGGVWGGLAALGGAGGAVGFGWLVGFVGEGTRYKMQLSDCPSKLGGHADVA